MVSLVTSTLPEFWYRRWLPRHRSRAQAALWSCQCDIKMAVRSAGVRTPQNGLDWRRRINLSTSPSNTANTPDIGPSRIARHSSKTGRTLASHDVIHFAKTPRALSKTAGFSRRRWAINRSISSERASMAECGVRIHGFCLRLGKSGRRDLNPGPLEPHSSALPS